MDFSIEKARPRTLLPFRELNCTSQETYNTLNDKRAPAGTGFHSLHILSAKGGNASIQFCSSMFKKPYYLP